MNKYLLLAFLSLIFIAGHAQNEGQITTSANSAVNPMDPDGDGWITSSGAAFTPGLTDDQTEFEIPYITIEQLGGEPNGDLQTGGSCGNTEIIDNSNTGSDAGYAYLLEDPDGNPATNDDKLLFRMRIAQNPSGAFGFSFLLDTDLKFGSIGPSADPNAVAGNPGFEYEIILGTGGSGKGVKIENVDGTTSGTNIITYNISSNHQRAEALNGDGACSGPYIFMDFYIEFADLGISKSAPLRMAYASSSSPSSALGSSASDVGGVNDGDPIYLDDDDMFEAAIAAAEPISFGNLNDSETTYSYNASYNIPSLSNGDILASASDADGSITSASLSSGSLPSGTTLNSDGSVTVSDVGALSEGIYTFEITTVDSKGGTTIQEITIELTNIPVADTDGDGITDDIDLDDDNDGIPDNAEDPCQKTFSFNLSSEGWYTINNNDNGQIGSNPASHSTDPVTGNVGCTISITGPANANIAGESPTNTHYIVDADPNGGLMYLRSPGYGGLDYTSILGGTFQYDIYNYRVGYTGNPSWSSDTKAYAYFYDTQGNWVRSEYTVSGAEFTNWENGNWNTFSFPIDDANWSGTQADLENVLSDVDYISLRMEFINGGNTGNCADVEYYAMDNVALTALPSCDNDDDNDGIPNSLDLDSDGDGIYDAVEAGHGRPHTDGRVDGPVSDDGIPDAVQTDNNSGAVDYTVNNAPELDLDSNDDSGAIGSGYEADFTEGDIDVAIADSDATLTDGDDTNLESLTITLTNRPDGVNEGLSVNGALPAGITVTDSYDNADGILVLSGSASIADYQIALQQVVYNNSSENPDETDRTITVEVSDGAANSNTGTTTLSVNTVNDVSTLDLDADNSSGAAGSDFEASFTEGDTDAAIVDADISITDADDTNLESVTITLTNRPNGVNEGLSVVGSLPSGITVTDSYDNADGILVLSGSASFSDYQTALQQVVYNNSGDDLDATSRAITIVANDGDGDSNTATTTLSMTAVNDVAVVDLDNNDDSGATGANYQSTFTEGDTDVAIADSDATIADVDNANLESLTVTLTNRPDGADEGLSVVGSLPSGITSSGYNNTTGILTLSGSSSVANYQAALQQIVYNNASGNPDETDRSVTVVVNDGDGNSSTATTALSVSAVNDAPELDLDADNSSGAVGEDYLAAFTEGDTDVAIMDTDVTITDVDNTQLSQVTVRLTNRPDGTSEGLSVVGSLPAGISVTDSYDNADGTLVLSGNASLADYQTALQQIVYNNSEEAPDETDRTITVVMNDGNADSNEATSTISVTSVNDAPTAADNTVTADEDVPLVIATGDLGYSDVDGDVLSKIIIDAAPVTGTLFVDADGDGVIDGGEALSATDEVSKADLDANRLKFLSAADENGVGYADFAFIVNDGTTDAVVANTITFDVDAVNDAPTAADNTLTIDEDVVLVIATGDLGYADTEGSTLSKITIDAIPASGTLFVDADGDGEADAGEILADDDEVSKADLDANRLKFLPATDDNGAGYAGFDFIVNDGTADANAASTITFNVNAINDAPEVTAASTTESTDEDTDLVFSTANGNALSVADVDGDTQTVTITATNGTFTLSQTTGLTFTVGDGDDDDTMTFSGSVADINAALSGASFTPAANYNGTASVNVATDDGNGETYDITVDITVDPFNDAPTADNESITIDEDSDHIFSDTDFSANYADVEGDNFDGIKITGLETAGSLLLNDVDVEVNDVISLADLSGGNLVFRPDADQNGTPYATFTFQVADATGNFSSDYTFTTNVNSIADVPESADRTITTDEDADYTFNNADFAFTDDADGDNFASVILTSLPDQGTLLYNGIAVSESDVTSETAFADRNLFTYSPAENGNGAGYTSFGFIVVDDAGDESEENTITVDVTAVNDAPVLTNVDKPAPQDKVTTFATIDFTDQFSDVEGDELTKVQITSLPANGTLRLNGVDVTLNDEIAVADLPDLTYEPDPAFSGSDSFTWNGHDGTEYAAAGAQVDINVLPQQVPVLTSVPKIINEDETVVFTTADFTNQFSDADGDPLTKIQITSLPANGTLFLDGVAVAENDEIDVADLSQLTFVPDADFNGTTAFNWNGHDGFQYAASEASVELTIDAVQDAPVLSEVSKEGEEDQPVAFTTADFTDQFSDADDEVLTKIQIVSLPENGTLYLNGVAVEANDEIPADQLDQLTFEPNPNFNGSDSFTWNAFDGTAYATDPVAVTMTVEAVADGAPVAIPATFTVSTDGTISAGVLAGFVTDPEGSGLVFSSDLITAPAHGSLMLNNDGTFTYTPDPGYTGDDSFTYQVCDRSTPEQCTSGTVNVAVGDSSSADSDNDGIPDSIEIGSDPNNPADSDGDGTPDFQDTDSDNDGVPDTVEAGDNPESPDDTDGDGTPDFMDTDSDGDGLSDTVEASDDPTQPADSDGDGIPDIKETDSDGDGMTDSTEAGADPANPTDTDGDGIPDFQDTDSDNDGLADAIEVGSDPNNPKDSDGDGIPDAQDTDSDNDGVSDTLEAGGDPNTPVDTDGDGIPDFQDTDSDGDGLSDTIEAGANPNQLIDTDGDGIPDLRETDSDGDGVSDATEAGGDPLNPRDSDNDGIPDFQDTDSDNDGVPDGEEDPIVIYKGFSPNQDGKNEVWQIDGIEKYPNNTVQIFNRWGNKIFEMQGYNNEDRAWSSESSLGLVLGASEVPDGTYFYIIDLGNGEKPLKGYITVHR